MCGASWVAGAIQHYHSGLFTLYPGVGQSIPHQVEASILLPAGSPGSPRFLTLGNTASAMPSLGAPPLSPVIPPDSLYEEYGKKKKIKERDIRYFLVYIFPEAQISG